MLRIDFLSLGKSCHIDRYLPTLPTSYVVIQNATLPIALSPYLVNLIDSDIPPNISKILRGSFEFLHLSLVRIFVQFSHSRIRIRRVHISCRPSTRMHQPINCANTTTWVPSPIVSLSSLPSIDRSSELSALSVVGAAAIPVSLPGTNANNTEQHPCEADRPHSGPDCGKATPGRKQVCASHPSTT